MPTSLANRGRAPGVRTNAGRSVGWIAGAAMALLLAWPAPARADWLLTPYLGVSFGGATQGEHLAYGGSIAWMGAGVIGVEFDAAIAPDLLEPEGEVDFDLTDSSVTTLMGNLIIGAPLGSPGIRPYVSGGAGLMRINVETLEGLFDVDDNSFGVNIGGGLIAFVNNNVGFRGDVRYFRSLRDDEGLFDIDLGGFDFWRGTAGVTIRF